MKRLVPGDQQGCSAVWTVIGPGAWNDVRKGTWRTLVRDIWRIGSKGLGDRLDMG